MEQICGIRLLRTKAIKRDRVKLPNEYLTANYLYDLPAAELISPRDISW